MAEAPSRRPSAQPLESPGSPGSPVDAGLRGPGLVVLVAAAVTLLCALAFPLAPVHQPVVTFSWPQAPDGTSVALPLMPYQPVRLDAAVSCAAARTLAPGAAVLATTPPGTPDGPTGGLRVLRTPDGLAVTSGGIGLARVPLPAGDCTVSVASDPRATTVALDGAPVATDRRDVRPTVSGVFTAAPTTAGLRLDLRTDTRFQTTPTVAKLLLGAGVLAGLAGVVGGVRRAEGRAPPARTRRRARRRARPVDLAVGAGLVVWAVVGPATVDDGYIAGIVRSRGENGFVGNVFRWLDAPEAPFSWFYEVDRAWAALAPGPASVLWMRVPATVLGVLCWLLVSHRVLPRLGPLTARRGAVWTAAVLFGAWWLPFDLSLRPEPWVAAGTLGVWVAVENAVATRRALPLVVAAVLAGLTVALTPGALEGLVPLLVALPALVRAGRARSGDAPALPGVGALPRVAAVVAGLAVAVLPMAADQGLAGILEATRVRQLIGGGAPWYQELTRYTTLLTTGDVQGPLGSRLPVLLLLVALPAVAWVRRRGDGTAPGPVVRLLATTAIAVVLLTFSPTKWTLHFGAFAGLGTAVLTLFVRTFSPRALRRPGSSPTAAVAVLGAGVLAAALVLLGFDQWAYAGNWGVFWSTIAPQVAGVPLSDVVLDVGIVVVVVAAVVVAVRGAERPLPRVLAVGPLALALVVVLVALQGLAFVKATVDRRGTFSYGGDSLAALGGDPCGMPRDLRVETDPAAGLLPAAGVAALDGVVPLGPDGPLVVGGRALPGWTAPLRDPAAGPATLRSAWYPLPEAARRGDAPVVVTVAGSTGTRAGVTLEFSTAPATPPGSATAPVSASSTPSGDTAGTAPRDLRAVAPAGATLVRVVATSADRTAATAAASSPTGAAGDTPLAVSAPRVPRTLPFDVVVPPGTTALADWPVALVVGCLRPAPLTAGTAAVPTWRVVAPDGSDAGEIEVAATTGGPFLGPRQLVDEIRYPVYLAGEPTRDPLGLVRWVPRQPLGALVPRVGSETVAGWTRDGRATVPSLDLP